MVYLSKIYTKTGDDGTTQLGDGSTLPKHHPRVASYGTSDELSSVLGLAIVDMTSGEDAEGEAPREAQWLRKIQHDLFDVGSDLCVPGEAGEKLRITDDYVTRLADELGATPSATMGELAAAVSRGEPRSEPVVMVSPAHRSVVCERRRPRARCRTARRR